ncbi:hypothetical protein JYU34_012651 [Plutella xylostella]|uniref:Uncharacterized protein n=2 Tax=Plutella xylostella TaxID=51655 RepID=A0ABQ7QD74_PLUXY|nr:hypothetical protein JYU34_012651 [Plutella xylostella]
MFLLGSLYFTIYHKDKNKPNSLRPSIAESIASGQTNPRPSGLPQVMIYRSILRLSQGSSQYQKKSSWRRIFGRSSQQTVQVQS